MIPLPPLATSIPSESGYFLTSLNLSHEKNQIPNDHYLLFPVEEFSITDNNIYNILAEERVIEAGDFCIPSTHIHLRQQYPHMILNF